MGEFLHMTHEAKRLILQTAQELEILDKIQVLLFVYEARFKTNISPFLKQKIIKKSSTYKILHQLQESGFISVKHRSYFMYADQKKSTDYLFLSLLNSGIRIETKTDKKPKEWLEA